MIDPCVNLPTPTQMQARDNMVSKVIIMQVGLGK
jgi:hypothetical protein